MLIGVQPPSGGCVLKRRQKIKSVDIQAQPPSGGCVLKLTRTGVFIYRNHAAAFRRLCVETAVISRLDPACCQPPSGGCVLKPAQHAQSARLLRTAAFRRLCVETAEYQAKSSSHCEQPPSGGCVLKQASEAKAWQLDKQPPSGGCVLKRIKAVLKIKPLLSRLQAAVC